MAFPIAFTTQLEFPGGNHLKLGVIVTHINSCCRWRQVFFLLYKRILTAVHEQRSRGTWVTIFLKISWRSAQNISLKTKAFTELCLLQFSRPECYKAGFYTGRFVCVEEGTAVFSFIQQVCHGWNGMVFGGSEQETLSMYTESIHLCNTCYNEFFTFIKWIKRFHIWTLFIQDVVACRQAILFTLNPSTLMATA